MIGQEHRHKDSEHTLVGFWIRKIDGEEIQVYGGKGGSVFWRDSKNRSSGRVDCDIFLSNHKPKH